MKASRVGVITMGNGVDHKPCIRCGLRRKVSHSKKGNRSGLCSSCYMVDPKF